MAVSVVVGTGHRPKDLPCGYDQNHSWAWKARQSIREELIALEPREVISGMALGYDQWLAKIAISLSIPLVAAVPCEGQESTWPQESQDFYRKLLSRASTVEVVTPGPYTPACMQVRNIWMVDRAKEANGILLSLWNRKEHGGTYNCISYARSKDVRILNIWPS